VAYGVEGCDPKLTVLNFPPVGRLIDFVLRSAVVGAGTQTEQRSLTAPFHPTRQFALAALNAGFAPHCGRSDAHELTGQIDPQQTLGIDSVHVA
jgi:hypothetical protein